MHVLGKVLLGLCILGAVGAVGLTAKLVNVRNSWTKRVAELKQENEKTADELRRQRIELKSLRNQLAREELGWGKSWSQANVSRQADGTLIVDGVGRRQGLGLPEGPNSPVVHAFQPAPGGGMAYVGPFQATTVEENRAALRPAWKVRPGEADSWTSGPDWRLRTQVPAGFLNRFHDLQSQLVNVDQRLANEQSRLEDQKNSLADANNVLAVRLEELEGDPDAPEGVPAEFSDGLLAVLERVQNERSAGLEEVDALRHKVHQTNERLNAVLQENLQLARQLTEKTEEPAATAAAPADSSSR
ncbi:MAG: hypothetical protein KDA79_02410 [Planctomycetaceae bacterium]|nr:hypothetical protein [Planctomycetaceae bacterium]